MSFLITAATSAQAYQLKSIIGQGQTIFLGDYLALPSLMVSSGRMIRTPDPAGPSFAHEMLTLCLDKGITVLCPLRKAELFALAETRQLFIEFDIQLIMPGLELMAGHFSPVDGTLLVINAGHVIAGQTNIPIPQELTDGIIMLNNIGNYQVFTAD